ncbi:THxN family PEP-CTERM protein [uncultured Roseovarius sp.]|uniref:THxN family PEP-CTERM protein n=1 Tax=uncultured Roseovarius sp. TaxID=293344 RepID=UPI0026210378|nr:THxN family PEP-CTERM protein [uncultured Roseovarius sp.]
MSWFKTIAAAAVVAVAATAGSAATLTINSVTGVWENANPAAGISGVGTNEISWGNPTNGNNKSRYRFDGAAPPPFIANEGSAFSLGKFTHFNNPITGTSLLSANLKVTINVAGVGDINSTFSFAHTETPNGANPCANGGAQGAGVNINGCADLVQATLNLASTDVFQIGGIDYVFDVSGFLNGGSLLDKFWTKEKAANMAELQGAFVTRDSVVIPLPAAGWLLIGGLGVLGAVKRRSKKA